MTEPPVLSYAQPDPPPVTAADVARRALLWTVVCGISAAPSFMWATHAYNRWAMVTGVAFFIVLYTWLSCTRAFLVFHQKPFVRSTLYVGYVTRVCVSIAFPLGMVVDLIPGMISVALASGLAGGPSAESFLHTLVVTLIQGTILNIVLSLYMLVVWGVQRIFMKVPTEARGFPVIPPSEMPPAPRA